MGKAVESGKSSLVATKNAIKAKSSINKNAKIDKITADEEHNDFICQTCGKHFTKRQGNFSPNKSAIYAGSDGYINTCRSCIDKLFRKYTEFYSGSEEKAIQRICEIYDFYFNESALSASKKISEGRSRINTYIAKINIMPHTGKTYSDYLIENHNNTIESFEQLEELRSQGKTSITNAALERWGTNFNEDEIKVLEEHYKMLKKQNPNCDSNQEIFVKDLCYIKLQQLEAMKNKKTDDFDKLTKLYRDTFKQAGLKTVQELDSSNDEAFGVTLSVISQYTPEEYYKDRKLYKDFDGLESYFTRFITRPLKNLMTGSKDRDEEFCVKNDDDDDE